MKFFIHEKCWGKLFDLPKATQKKVLEFQKKFRENSKSEAIHLEPISTFKDPYLRTARIDLKYRAIIRVPETGDSYHLLWVDNHDEAMDWAKNKIFQWNENTQTAQIFTSLEVSVEKPIAPLATEGNMFSIYDDDKLLAIGVPKQLLNLVKSIKNLDEFEECEKYLPVDAFENLFRLSDGANIELLIAEINEGKSASENRDDQFISVNNKRSFVEVDDELLAEIINGELSKWQVFLHPSQRKLVESTFKGSVKITGGAGTGKTVVALHRLKKLSEIPSITDNRKILFTTFTNALTVNLNLLASKLAINPNKYLIANIDTIVRDLSKQFNLVDKSIRILDVFNSKRSVEIWDEILEQNLSEFDTNYLYLEYQNVILYNDVKSLDEYYRTSRVGRGKPISRKQKMDIWNLVEAYEARKKKDGYLDRAELFNIVASSIKDIKQKPFKHLIADEVQDLSNVELRFLRSLVEEKEDDLFLVGDPYQKIYSRKINFAKAGIHVRGTRSRQLKINYRTSEEIKKLAITAVKGINYDDFDGETEKLNGYLSLFHGLAPTYEIFRTKTEEIAELAKEISTLKEGGIDFKDIAIGCRMKDSIKEIKTNLHKLKIPYHDNTSNPTASPNGVLLSTFHGLKGLEFKAVLLADVNNRTSPLYFTKMDDLGSTEMEEYLNSERSLIYVAVTRAINILKIYGTGVKSNLITLNK